MLNIQMAGMVFPVTFFPVTSGGGGCLCQCNTCVICNWNWSMYQLERISQLQSVHVGTCTNFVLFYTAEGCGDLGLSQVVSTGISVYFSRVSGL